MTEYTSRVLLNGKQAGPMLGLKPCTLEKRRQLGLPPSFLKVGRKVFYDQKELEAFLDRCARESTVQSKIVSEDLE
jgi:hypothetical protein